MGVCQQAALLCTSCSRTAASRQGFEVWGYLVSHCVGGMADVPPSLMPCRYYFLKDLHPAAGGGRYLETPTFLKRWLLQAGIGQVNVREVPMSHPSDVGFRAFSGRGRRLAS